MYSTRTQHTIAIYPADKPGPKHMDSKARVIFRIEGEKLLRYFDGNEHANPNCTAAEACQAFVDHCRAILRLDGYDPEKKTWISYTTPFGNIVDYFQCDHPEVTI